MPIGFSVKGLQLRDPRIKAVGLERDNFRRVYGTSCPKTLKMPSVAFLLQIILLFGHCFLNAQAKHLRPFDTKTVQSVIRLSYRNLLTKFYHTASQKDYIIAR